MAVEQSGNLKAGDITLPTGEVICDGCEYQALHLSISGNFAQLDREICVGIVALQKARTGISTDALNCGLAIQSVIGVAKEEVQ